MCGIVGLLSDHPVTADLIAGLRRLEYRGYDSSGIAGIVEGSIARRRAPGRITELEKVLAADPLEPLIGIAHTRWATHGRPNEANAHPHRADGVAIVHNGIIENHEALRSELQAQGQVFESETDTEVIPRLISQNLTRGDEPLAAIRGALARLEGSFAVAILLDARPDTIFAARKGSPLVLGRRDGVAAVASDTLALAGMVDQVMYLGDCEIAALTRESVSLTGAGGTPVEAAWEPATQTAEIADKGAYEHFMLKEIFEQPSTVARTAASYLHRTTGEVTIPSHTAIPDGVSRITIVACGTSYHAGLVARYMIERVAGIPVDVDTASEFRYRTPPLDPNGIALFISQSGETADTLAALRHVKERGIFAIGLVNAAQSSIARESDVVMRIETGPEIGVASTKAFTAQLVALYCLGMVLARRRGAASATDERDFLTALAELPGAISATLAMDEEFAGLVPLFDGAASALFIGRGPYAPLALEGALKLKEISYVHAEGYGAGELKHGPIALIDERMPVVAVAPFDELFDKTASNLEEVAARDGRLIVFTDRKGAEKLGVPGAHVIALPRVYPLLSPILHAVPMQLLAYHVARARGTDIDKPRNLAKSVTVE